VHHRLAVNAFVYLTVISRWGWHVGYEDGGVVQDLARSPVPRRLVSAVSSLVMQIRTIIQFLKLIFHMLLRYI